MIILALIARLMIHCWPHGVKFESLTGNKGKCVHENVNSITVTLSKRVYSVELRKLRVQQRVFYFRNRNRGAFWFINVWQRPIPVNTIALKLVLQPGIARVRLACERTWVKTTKNRKRPKKSKLICKIIYLAPWFINFSCCCCIRTSHSKKS